MIDLFDLIKKQYFISNEDCYIRKEEMIIFLNENNIKYDIQSTYDLIVEDYTKWDFFVWLLYGRQLVGGYYQLEQVPTYGYTVYVMHRESGIDPYVIYFLFSPDRTRVVFYDFIVTH